MVEPPGGVFAGIRIGRASASSVSKPHAPFPARPSGWTERVTAENRLACDPRHGTDVCRSRPWTMALPQGDGPDRQLEDAAREVAPWIVALARIGYLAKALLYATVGILAAQAALGSGGRTTDLGGALREVVRAPMGEAMLLVIAAGLAAYALWRVVDAVFDGEGKGGDLKGIARRIGSALRGLAH